MGTTINGVYEGGKRLRRKRALQRLELDYAHLDESYNELLSKEKKATKEDDKKEIQLSITSTLKRMTRMGLEMATLRERI